MKEKLIKKGTKKRLLSAIIVLTMILTLMPMNALTAYAETKTDTFSTFVDQQQTYTATNFVLTSSQTGEASGFTGWSVDTDGVFMTKNSESYGDCSVTITPVSADTKIDSVVLGVSYALNDWRNVKHSELVLSSGTISDPDTKFAQGQSITISDINATSFTISAPTSCNGHTLQFKPITVNGSAVIAATGVSLNKSTTSLAVGAKETLTATVAPSDATNKAVTWSSDATSVATVNASTGEITAVGVGTATITATTADGSKTASCTVTVTPASHTGTTINTEPLTGLSSSSYPMVVSANDKIIFEVTNPSYTVRILGVSNTGTIDWTGVFESGTTEGNYEWTAESDGILTLYDKMGTLWRVIYAKVPDSFSSVPATKHTEAECTHSSEAHFYATGNTYTIVSGGGLAAEGRWFVDKVVDYYAGQRRGDVVTRFPNSTPTAGWYYYNSSGSNWLSCAPPITYSVTFDANGHGTAPAAISGIESDATITAPTAPEAEGYTFGGWYKEAGCTNAWNFASDTVSADVTLYAKWTADTVAVTGVTLNKTSATLTVGGTETLTATVAPSNATNKAVTWSSNHTDVATVSDAGLITAVGAGTATITATTTDGSFTATCTVTVNSGEGSGSGITPTPTPTPDPTPTPAPAPAPAPSPAPNVYTVPVTSENTVHVEATVDNNVATVSEITSETIANVGNNNSVVIDVSGANVDSVVVSKSTLETLTNAVNSTDNKINTVEVKLSNAKMEFDKIALNSLLSQADGSNIKLCVDDNDVSRFNETQQNAIKNKNVAAVFDAYVESNGTRIHNFDGGNVYVTVEFTPVPGTDTRFYHVEYVAPDGRIERYETRFTAEGLQFIVPHLSDYVIVYDTTLVKSPKTGDNVAWIYVMLLMGTAMAGYGLIKRKSSR